MFTFFLPISDNLLLLPHSWSDFDQTWSEVCMGEPLKKLYSVWPQRLCRGHRGQKGHFHHNSSFFLTIYYSFDILGPISTKLGQKYVWVNRYKSYTRFDLKGHVGVTGVKKVIFTRKVSTPLGYMVWLWDSWTWSSLRPSTKVIILKNYPGSFGVTGVKTLKY